MADVTVKVLEPATSFDFMTVEEAKLWLRIPDTDTSQDAQLQMMISVNSAIIAEMCNRTFAREKVTETWREVMNGRVFLTHWPVKEDDIENVYPGGTLYPSDAYELEEASGKLSNVSGYVEASAPWPQAIKVTYTGGFNLPDEAPLPLKHATWMLMLEDRMRSLTAQFGGIRQLRHKEASVNFFNPNEVLMKSLGAGSATMQTINSLLSQYMRFWV